MSYYKTKPLIAERVLLIGENAIPRETLDQLTDEHVQMFLREPDPSLWPDDMTPLVDFLSHEERLKLAVWSACSEHEAELRELLRRWTLAVLAGVAEKEDTQEPNAHLIIGEMATYLKTLMAGFLADRIARPPDPGE